MNKFQIFVLAMAAGCIVFSGCKKDNGDGFEDKEAEAKKQAVEFSQLVKSVGRWKIFALKQAYESPNLVQLEECQKNASFEFKWTENEQGLSDLVITREFVCQGEHSENLEYNTGFEASNSYRSEQDRHFVLAYLPLRSTGLEVSTDYQEVFTWDKTQGHESFTVVISDSGSPYNGYVLTFRPI